MPPLPQIFSWVCGQEHVWTVGGEQLPFCQRCTGLYVGALPALGVFLLLRPKPSNRMLWVHGLLLLLMVPFGYHLVPQTATMRMLTGQLFAIGLVYYLTLLSGARWRVTGELSLVQETGYFACGAASLVTLQVAVRCGGPGIATALSWMGFGGLFIYGGLVLWNLALLVAPAWQLLRTYFLDAES